MVMGRDDDNARVMISHADGEEGEKRAEKRSFPWALYRGSWLTGCGPLRLTSF